MVRLLTTTALVAVVSTSTFASELANQLKSNLNNAYTAYGQNFATHNNGAVANAYGALLHGIDNPTTAGEEFDASALGAVNAETGMMAEAAELTAADFNLGTAVDIEQLVENLVTAVETDFISDTGFVTQSVNTIVAAAITFNGVVTDTTKTIAERETARDVFIGIYNPEIGKYNAAVRAFNATVTLDNATDYTAYALGGIPDGYASYTDWVIENPLVTIVIPDGDFSGSYTLPNGYTLPWDPTIGVDGTYGLPTIAMTIQGGGNNYTISGVYSGGTNLEFTLSGIGTFDTLAEAIAALPTIE